MASRVSRWVGVTVLACAAIAAVLLPPRAPPVRSSSVSYPASWVFNRARDQFDNAVNSLRLLHVRDTLLATASRAAVVELEGLQVVAATGVPTRVTDPATVLIERAWAQVDASANGVPVIVGLLLDTSYTYEGYERSHVTRLRNSYVIPTGASDSPACFSLIDLGPNPQAEAGADLHLPAGGVSQIRERAFGPCKYYAAFGMPGDDIARWLLQWEYIPIGSANWSTARLEGQERGSWYYWGWGRNLTLTGCVAGDRAKCLAAVRSRPGEGWMAVPRARFSPPGVLVGRRSWVGNNDSRDALGWAARYFLADMVVEFGRDRFARFWTSDEPFEEAFGQAMGMPIEDWTMQWARRYGGTPRSTGRYSSGSVLLSLLLAGAFVGAAGVYSRHRQVI